MRGGQRTRTCWVLLLLTVAPALATAAQGTSTTAGDAGGAAPAAAAPVPPEDGGPRGYLTFYLDNDLFGGSDRNYTNGVRASWISEAEPLLNFLPMRRTLEQLAGADGDYKWVRLISGFEADSVRDGTLELNYGLSLTQLMFTPEDFASPTQPVGERRYAGWLGLGFSVHARDARALNTVEFIVGTTGPNSLAEEAQDFIHELRDFDTFEGWDDQIPDEITLDLAFSQKRRLRFLDQRRARFSVDGFGEWGLRLGSFRTLGYAGAFFRMGFNLPADFSDPRISANAYSHKFFERGLTDRRAWSSYLLFGVRGYGIAFDATLDGPLFSDFDTGNEREPWVGEAFVGFGLRYRLVELSYAHTFRSEEFEEQRAASDFGSLALRWRL